MRADHLLSKGTYLWIEATIDVAISSVLVIRLRAHFKALGKQHLNVAQRLQRLLRVSLRTAAVTSIFACCGALIATIPLNGITTINGLFAFTREVDSRSLPKCHALTRFSNSPDASSLLSELHLYAFVPRCCGRKYPRSVRSRIATACSFPTTPRKFGRHLNARRDCHQGRARSRLHESDAASRQEYCRG